MTSVPSVLICGGGPVGIYTALLLDQVGYRVQLVHARTDQISPTTDFRAIALSVGSQQLLQQARITPSPITPIQQVHVSQAGFWGRTRITAAEYKLSALGGVIGYTALCTSMIKALKNSSIHIINDKVIDIQQTANHVTALLANTPSITCDIAVVADGGHLSTPADYHCHDYEQSAMIAWVGTNQPQSHTAYERFTNQGPIALLPWHRESTQHHGYALVWTRPTHQAQQLHTEHDDVFLKQLQQNFGYRAGILTQVEGRQQWPLRRQIRTHTTDRRIVWIGNAAQTLHPVAGQGLNLGLRDAWVLSRSLRTHTHANTLMTALSHYTQARHTDRQVTARITHSLAVPLIPIAKIDALFKATIITTLDLCSIGRQHFADAMMYGQRQHPKNMTLSCR